MFNKFITFEGPEGSGKTSIIEIIEKRLQKNCIDCLVTKEPGSKKDQLCMDLRNLILSPSNEIHKETELYLYMADRCQHVNMVVLPALKRGKVVLCDRYIDSTYAYQGWGRRNGNEKDLEYINLLNHNSTGGLVPALTFILKVSPQKGFERLNTSEFGEKDRIERETVDFFEKVNYGFSEIVKNNKNRKFKVIDTDNYSLEQISIFVWNEIIDHLHLNALRLLRIIK